MDRRSFLALAAGSVAAAGVPKNALANLEGQKGLRLSVTWGMMGRMPVPEALALLTRLGYDAYEMFDWRDPKLLEAFVAEKGKHPLACACLVANKGVEAWGCGLVNPRDREGFLREIHSSVEAAKKIDAKRLVVLTGNELGGMPRSQQMSNAVAALREAAPILEKNGVTAIVEILNTYVDHAGYFLYYVRDGAELVDRVGSPNVKLLFDIYHSQVMEGNLIQNIRMNIDRIGHFHVGDVPGRHEPGTGEINYRNVFKAIYDLGDRFPGYVALEYGRVAPLEENLAAMRKLANFA
jgi:hydroxypyruvate isomerase